MKRVTSKSFWYVVLLLSLALLAWNAPAIAYASTEIAGETDGNSVRVVTENRSTVSRGPTVRNLNQPPATRSGSNANHTRNVRTDSGYRSQNNSGNAPAATQRCENRSEFLSAMVDGRECDPSIRAEVISIPGPGQPEPEANDQQLEIVSEPVEIVITSSDLLELIPASPQILMDRGPFGLKNAHTNFYASNHRPQTVTRTMFDQEVTITATPVEYRWDYGDGETLVTDVPGHPDEVFNTETETSHQYTDTGLYTVALTTVFEGTYQVDGGATQTVSSPVTQVADPVEIRIWRAVTRNVDQTCLQNPSAWGC